MLEADGNKRWGGVFRAKIEDAMPTSNANTKEPKLLKKFDNWDETKCNLAKRLPYLLDNPTSYLTTENTVNIFKIISIWLLDCHLKLIHTDMNKALCSTTL